MGLAEALLKPAARDMASRVDRPAFDRSAMDGYALNCSSLSRLGRLRVSGELLPSSRRAVRLGRGAAAYVSTGAPIPPGADAVARVESCRVKDGVLTVHERVHPGKDIQVRGNDVRKHQVLARKGELLTAYHLGILSSAGIARVPVFRVRMAIVSIGDEISPFTGASRGKTLDSISPMIVALSGFAEVRYMGTVPDDTERISSALHRASASADLVVTIGGSSVGRTDYTKKVVASEGELLFEGVSVNTMKRAAVGRVGRVPVIILPGQPVSAVVAFHEHGLHVLSRMVGRELRRYQTGALDHELRVDHKMDSVYLFQLRDGAAHALPWGVGLHNTLSRANSFGILRRHATYRAGSRLPLQMLYG